MICFKTQKIKYAIESTIFRLCFLYLLFIQVFLLTMQIGFDFFMSNLKKIHDDDMPQFLLTQQELIVCCIVGLAILNLEWILHVIFNRENFFKSFYNFINAMLIYTAIMLEIVYKGRMENIFSVALVSIRLVRVVSQIYKSILERDEDAFEKLNFKCEKLEQLYKNEVLDAQTYEAQYQEMLKQQIVMKKELEKLKNLNQDQNKQLQNQEQQFQLLLSENQQLKQSQKKK